MDQLLLDKTRENAHLLADREVKDVVIYEKDDVLTVCLKEDLTLLDAKVIEIITPKIPKYPKIKVKLIGEDGNAFSILGRVSDAMRRRGVSKEDIERFREMAMSGGYDNLLVTCMKWVNVT